MTYTGLVHAQGHTECPYSVAQDYAEDYLRRAEGGGPEATIVAGPFGRRVLFRFALRTDVAEIGRPHDEIVMRWFARSALLPDFVGTLRMRIVEGGTSLIFDGRYLPPFGFFGALFDRLVGNRIAQATAHDLVRRVADALDQRERTWRAAHGFGGQRPRHA
jgi:hypothetical protein